MDASGDPREGFGERGSVAAGTRPSAGERRAVPRGSSGVALARPAKSLVRFLYTSNPFYILSADLVFVGLRMSFGPGGPAAQSWALTMSLAGYTLLLATTACVLIRVGRLWDDLRSLLVLVVMMFLAIAMSCDDTMAANPSKGGAGLHRWIPVRGRGHRGRPAHDPAEVARLVSPGLLRDPGPGVPVSGRAESRSWATRRIRRCNGHCSASRRWRRWPSRRWCPRHGAGGRTSRRTAVPGDGRCTRGHSSFVLVGGLCVRCMSLCVSFHYVEGSRTIFGPYFLVPIGLAVSLVWLEIGIVSGRRGIMTAASALPLGLVYLTMMAAGQECGLRGFPGAVHPDPRGLRQPI